MFTYTVHDSSIIQVGRADDPKAVQQLSDIDVILLEVSP